MQMEQKDFRHIVRIANTDLDGRKMVIYGLAKIKGVGVNFANMACKLAGVDSKKRVGNLLEVEAKKIEEVILNPQKFKAPAWMFDRRRDPATGEDQHLTSAGLLFNQENDIKMLKKIKSYKGIRHIAGLPVRGQRTKSNFRKNKGKASLGVVRNKTAAPAKDQGKKKE